LQQYPYNDSNKRLAQYRGKNCRAALMRVLCFSCLCNRFHHLADVSYTSAAFWVFPGTITPAPCLFLDNLFKDYRAAIFQIVFFNLLFRILAVLGVRFWNSVVMAYFSISGLLSFRQCCSMPYRNHRGE